MRNETPNPFCIPGRFWSTLPARERSAEEIAVLGELAALVQEEAAEEASTLAAWVAS